MGMSYVEAALIVLSLTDLRVLIPLLAIDFLIQEGREVFELRQLTSITLFASFYLVAGYQLAVGRTLNRWPGRSLPGMPPGTRPSCSSPRSFQALMQHWTA